MGKGTIVSSLDDGLYNVRIRYNREMYDGLIAQYTSEIASLTTQLEKLEIAFNNAYLSGDKAAQISITRQKNLALSQKMALELAKKKLEDNMPEDEVVEAWCADYTEDLTGDVITVEVPGEVISPIQIHPGFENAATYNKDKAGALLPTILHTPAQAYGSMAMFTGWQKWKPMYRYGVITAIDEEIADVDLEPATSIHLDINSDPIDLNQTESLTDVVIEYMDCSENPPLRGW